MRNRRANIKILTEGPLSSIYVLSLPLGDPGIFRFKGTAQGFFLSILKMQKKSFKLFACCHQ